MYAVYPISEPPTTRYATAPMPRAVQVTRERSRFSSAKIELPTPAKKTCHAVSANVGRPDCHFFESTDPKAQLSEPPISATDHQSCRCPMAPVARSCGQSRTSVPVKPSASPAKLDP